MSQARTPQTALLALLALTPPSSTFTAPSRPEVTIANGTIIGTYNPILDVDSFLGIPYAQPPVGTLRFEPPVALNTSWTSPLDASEYGPWCLGYSINLPSFTQPDFVYPQSEDCLTLNIVRPAASTRPAGAGAGAATNNSFLPVLLWIHGGGFSDGGSSDLRYNLSTLAATSAIMGAPTIMMSINYRLSGWGFLASRARLAAGRGNNGLRDQMLALEWVQDNIGAFGGDAARVTIYGESAGAFSVGMQLLAYGDKNNNTGDAGGDRGARRPFRGAIAQSGSAMTQTPAYSMEAADAQFDAVLQAANCSSSCEDSALGCLRAKQVDALQAAFSGDTWWPKGDGVLLPLDTLRALHDGAFARVPLLIGTSTNEGSSVVSSSGITPIAANSTSSALAAAAAAINALLGPILPNATFAALLKAYAALNLHCELGTVLPDPGPAYGSAYGLTTLLAGDLLFTAGHRVSNRVWTARGVPSWSYRFDTIPGGIDPLTLGVAHFHEIGFVFGNVDGQGWSADPFNVEPAERRERYERLAQLMSRMWISFANTLSPNNHGLPWFDVEWPKYDNSNPVNMVFDGNTTSYLEPDNWRKEVFDILSNENWCVSHGSQC